MTVTRRRATRCAGTAVTRRLRALVTAGAIALCVPMLTAAGEPHGVDALIAAEHNRVLDLLATGDHQAAIEAAELVTAAGLDDPAVVDAIERRLTAEHGKLAVDQDDETYAVVLALLRALSATGEPRVAMTLREYQFSGASRGVRNRAKHAASKVPWFAIRNQVMRRTDRYRPGMTLSTMRLLNLLKAEDDSLRRWAAEELNRSDGPEPLLIDTAAESLAHEIAEPPRDALHEDVLAWFCVLLNQHGRPRHDALLLRISGDRSLSRKIRKHARG